MHVKIKIGYHGLSLIVITPDKTISSLYIHKVQLNISNERVVSVRY